LSATSQDIEVLSLMGTIDAQKWKINETQRIIREEIEEPMMELFPPTSRPSPEDIRGLLDDLDRADSLDDAHFEKNTIRAGVAKYIAGKQADHREFFSLRTDGKILEADLAKDKSNLELLERHLEGYFTGGQEQNREQQRRAGPAALHLADILERANISDSEPSRDIGTEDLRGLKEKVKGLKNIIQISKDIRTTKRRIDELGALIRAGNTAHMPESSRLSHNLSKQEHDLNQRMESLSIWSKREAQRQYQEDKGKLSGHLDDIIRLDDNIQQTERYRDSLYTGYVDSKRINAQRGAEETLSELQRTLAWRMESLSIQSVEEAQHLRERL
jgi:hypothetical protein